MSGHSKWHNIKKPSLQPQDFEKIKICFWHNFGTIQSKKNNTKPTKTTNK